MGRLVFDLITTKFFVFIDNMVKKNYYPKLANCERKNILSRVYIFLHTPVFPFSRRGGGDWNNKV